MELLYLVLALSVGANIGLFFAFLSKQHQPQPQSEPDSLREDVLRWVFAQYEGVWTNEPEVRVLGTSAAAAAHIARKYNEFARRYPLSEELKNE